MGTKRPGAQVGSAPVPTAREAELALRWAAGEWRGRVLRTERGDSYTVLYQGRRGGGAGPDFRDAVLLRSDGARIAGDVELHLRASDWRAHGHTADRRYGGVVLHVVFTPLPPQAPTETPLPLGGTAPIAVLSRDLTGPTPSTASIASIAWPCAQLASRLGGGRLRGLLLAAGRERFAQREARFQRELALAEAYAAEHAAAAAWSKRDRTLFVAIGEALGYGRDRDALRLAGEALVTENAHGHGGTSDRLDGIERSRLSGLLELLRRWQPDGPWLRLVECIDRGPPRAAAKALVAELGADAGRISAGRARIVAANVILPFASAVATLEGMSGLAERALAVYEALPGLPSNAITRLMARQVGMRRLPTGAAAQQGLHYVWAMWCREKRCESCPCSLSDSAPPVPYAPHVRAKPATLLEDARPCGTRGSYAVPLQLHAASNVHVDGGAR